MVSRLIVEVRWGQMDGHKRVIDVGDALTVGRTERADLVVDSDRSMSGVHFSLAWDGERALLEDLDSHSGTLLDGESVKRGVVAHGGWIRAGETDFSIYQEDKIPPPAEAGSMDAETDDERWLVAQDRAEQQARVSAAASVLSVLRQASAKVPLFALVDASRDNRVLQLLRQSIEPYQSLYEGVEGEALASVAPYLVGPFRDDSALLERLLIEGWGRRWASYLQSPRRFKVVRRHFRRFLMVDGPNSGEALYFRFYDPGVLRTFWSVATRRQAADYAEELEAFFVEDGRHGLRRLSRDAQGTPTVEAAAC